MCRNFQLLEKQVTHDEVIVLSRMYENFIERGGGAHFSEQARNDARLYELWSGADHRHGSLSHIAWLDLSVN